MIREIKHKMILDIKNIDKISVNSTLKYTDLVSKKTNLKCKITHKILDDNKYIIGLVNEFNRIIPVIELKNSKDNLKISNLPFYTDIDKAIFEKTKYLDERVEIMNKKKYEDETYIRMKFELSKYLLKNKNDMNNIRSIIDENENEIDIKRKELYIILNNIFVKLISNKNKKIDFFDYKTPNKRIPCYLRKMNELNCDDDPHCVKEDNKCKLFINKINLLNDNIYNYNFYLSKLLDEILRYKMKRDEILEDKIPIIINKDNINKNTNKYIVIDTLNIDRLSSIIDELFLSKNNIEIDNRKLYETSDTKEIGFVKELYTKSNLLLTNKTEDLSIYWLKYLKHNFKALISENNNIFSIMVIILNLDQFKTNMNKYIDIFLLKNIIIDQISKMNESTMLKSYKYYNKKFKNMTSSDDLYNEILNESYEGSIPDLEIISKLYNINIVILDKRIKKNNVGYKIFKTETNYKSNYFILLYAYVNYDIEKYYLIENKNNYLFKINNFPPIFIKNIIETDNK
jgi:hypothetical protein